MIIRIGVDNIEISRFDKTLLSNPTFLNRCFTSKEQSYCFSKADPSPHFAVRFAAKEAVVKALSGFDLYLEHNKIEIINNEKGRPSINYLTNNLIYSNFNTDVSLSHSETLAIAFVVIFIHTDLFKKQTEKLNIHAIENNSYELEINRKVRYSCNRGK